VLDNGNLNSNFFDNYVDLIEFLNVNFTDMVITDIQLDDGGGARLCVAFFLNGSDDSFHFNQSNGFDV
jgi:hypothetical protein